MLSHRIEEQKKHRMEGTGEKMSSLSCTFQTWIKNEGDE